MHQPHDSGVRTINLPDGGVQIVVPPAGFWRTRKEPFVIGVLWLGLTAAFTVAGVAGAAGGRMPAMNIWDGLCAAAAIAVFWGAGFLMVYAGLRMACSRTVLTVQGGFLIMTRTDFFGASQERWRRTDIEKIDIGRTRQGFRGMPELKIHFRGGDWVGMLCGRYDRDLNRVADALRQALMEAARRAPPPSPDVTEQPAVSRAILERSANALTLEIPALGFRGKIPWMAAAAALAGVAASAVAWVIWVMADRPGSGSAWWGLGPLAVALVCFGAALEAVVHAFRRHVLTVEGAVLTVRHTTWWGGVRTMEWEQSQLTGIDVDPPNPTRAFTILPRLQIHRRDGRPKRLLLYHEEEELLWIATLLRQALRLPAPADKS